jgi:hypothetical protein
MGREVPGFVALADAAEQALAPRFADLPAPIRSAVDAWDARRRMNHGPGEPPMSDANKLTIAPMVMAAIRAFFEANERGEK